MRITGLTVIPLAVCGVALVAHADKSLATGYSMLAVDSSAAGGAASAGSVYTIEVVAGEAITGTARGGEFELRLGSHPGAGGPSAPTDRLFRNGFEVTP